MTDDFSLFHPRMRKPAAVAVVAGFTLGFLAVGAQRVQGGDATEWWLALLYGSLAAAMLYGVSYRNLKKRYDYEQSELGDDDGQ